MKITKKRNICPWILEVKKLEPSEEDLLPQKVNLRNSDNGKKLIISHLEILQLKIENNRIIIDSVYIFY